MKQREWWLSKSNGCLTTFEQPLDGHFKGVHVREVRPIDWLVINKKLYEKNVSTLFLMQDYDLNNRMD